ncbi:Similar to ATP5F1EP2: ATP synthase subunit epsilon-like protein [Cotesia congregata]|uniref:Mitochondrial (Homo sapiens) n=1 Tax=Cotesia congregata TaxID=51543 RepID=A0A8J2H8K2_COTCN|nr:Similar to ATP5F1EP2: ATP synthase subunit epsilon-like protein [Cotesia congregata]
MAAWRQAGLNYINYSQIAAKLVRQALKSEFRIAAAKRDDTSKPHKQPRRSVESFTHPTPWL